MKLKTIIALMSVMLALGCTDGTWTDEFDESQLYEVRVYGSQNTTYGTPHQRDSVFTYDCRDVAEDSWRYPSSYDEPFNWAYLKCNRTFPELIRAEIETIENYEAVNWTSMLVGALNITQDYSFNNFSGNITFYNTTCHQVTCECAKNTKTPCMAYCMECEELTEQ